MIKVFQVFKKSIKIPKPYYTPELRSDFKQWNEKIVSLNGHVKDQKLFLPIEQKSKLALSNPKTILIQDIIGYSGLKKEPKNGNICLPEWFLNQKNSRIKELFLFNGQTKNLDFEIFRMNQSEDKKFELNLNYLQNNLCIYFVHLNLNPCLVRYKVI